MMESPPRFLLTPFQRQMRENSRSLSVTALIHSSAQFFIQCRRLRFYFKTYADDNGIMLDEIVDELDIFVEDALRSVDEFGDSVAYTASYSFNGTVL